MRMLSLLPGLKIRAEKALSSAQFFAETVGHFTQRHTTMVFLIWILLPSETL